jgi:hypothetical protein
LSDDSPVDITLLHFTILKPYLPAGTKLTSTYRSPIRQLGVIQDLARRKNIRTGVMLVDDPNTWVPVLEKLRNAGVKVNAPTAGTKIPISPHTKEKIVFDMSGPDLGAIERGCYAAQKLGIMTFRQILREGGSTNAVHVEISSVNRWEWEKLYAEMGFAFA